MELGNFRPRADRVLLLVLPKESVSAGGIILPDERNGRENRARVIAVGPGRRIKGGEARVPMSVVVDDVVVFDPYRVLLAIGPTGIRANASEYARAGEYAVVAEDSIFGAEDPLWCVRYGVAGFGPRMSGPYSTATEAHLQLADIEGYEGVTGARVERYY
jgi:co-chaperonin GroES (HSP10)